MILALLLTVRALADSLVLRADEWLYDSTVVALAPHGTLEGIGQAIAIGTVVIVVLLVGGILYGLYSWLR